MKVIDRLMAMRVDRSARPHVLFAIRPHDILAAFQLREQNAQNSGRQWPSNCSSVLSGGTIVDSLIAANERGERMCWFATTAYRKNGGFVADYPAEFTRGAAHMSAWEDGKMIHCPVAHVKSINGDTITTDMLSMIEVPLFRYSLPKPDDQWDNINHGIFSESWDV